MALNPERPEEEPASSEEALAFILQLQQEFLHAEDSPENLEKLERRIESFESDKQKKIAIRVLMDIMKRSARTIGQGEPPTGGGAPPAKGGTRRKR